MTLSCRHAQAPAGPPPGMPDSGKVSREFFEEHIAPNLGTDRDDVAVGPTHGVDFGA